MPHGDSKSAIFRGANDKNYQVLAQWAKSLRPARGASSGQGSPRGFGEGVSRTGYALPETAPAEGFASERSGRSTGPSAPAQDFPARASVPPSRGLVERYNENAEFVTAPGDNPQFPAPFSVGGSPPPSRPAPPKAKAKPGAPANNAPSTPAVSKKTATPAGPGAVVVTTEDPNELPGMDQPRYPPKAKAKAEAEDDEADKIKPKPIDSAKLEKLLKTRNGGTPEPNPGPIDVP